MSAKRTVWLLDDEVKECFDLKIGRRHLIDGTLVARYFEALRFRQQLKPRTPFVFKSEDIRQVSGLSYKRQLKARKVLVGSGWISARFVRADNGTVLQYEITDLGREAIRHIRHPQNMNLFMKNVKRNSKIGRSDLANLAT